MMVPRRRRWIIIKPTMAQNLAFIQDLCAHCYRIAFVIHQNWEIHWACASRHAFVRIRLADRLADDDHQGFTRGIAAR